MKQMKLYTKFTDILILFILLTTLSVFIFRDSRIELQIASIFFAGMVGVVFIFLIDKLSEDKK